MLRDSRYCENCLYWTLKDVSRGNGECCLDDCFTGYSYSCKDWVYLMPKNSHICGNCKHWKESCNPNADTGICQLTHDCFTGRGYSCPEWQLKERQQMTVTKKKCCADCDHWLIEDHSHFYKCKCRELRIDVTHDFCCNKWQAKEKPKSKNTTIGIDLELNGVSEFVEELDKVEKRVEKFAAKLAHSLAAFNEMWNRSSLFDDD